MSNLPSINECSSFFKMLYLLLLHYIGLYFISQDFYQEACTLLEKNESAYFYLTVLNLRRAIVNMQI